MKQVLFVCCLVFCYSYAFNFFGNTSAPSISGAIEYVKNITFGSGTVVTTTLKPLYIEDDGESKCLRKNYANETSSIYMSIKEDWVYFNTTIWEKYASFHELNITLPADAKVLSQLYVLCQPYEESFEENRRLAAGALASLAG